VNQPAYGPLQSYSSSIAVLQRIGDALVITGALACALLLYGVPFLDQYWILAGWSIVLFFLFAEARGIYRSWRLASLREESGRVVATWVGVIAGMIGLAFLTKTSADFSRVALMVWFALAPAFLVALRVSARLLLRQLRRHGRNTRTVGIAGTGRLALQAKSKIEQAGWIGLRIVGFFGDPSPVGTAGSEDPPQARGDFTEMVARAHLGELDYIYIALPAVEERRIEQLVRALADTTASVYVVPDLFVSTIMQARWESIGGLPVISVFDTPFYGVDGWLKRLEDLLLASAILLLSAVPMLAIAAGVKLSSRGPVLFKQRRYGLNGRVVEVWKFRTMTVLEDGAEVPQATRNDPRVTPFGAFLRRTSLDELPQFFNVMMGDMSVVGPRPHAVAHNELYRGLIEGYMLRHKVKPGITGWAQVNGWRGEIDVLEKMQKRVEFDLEYIREWSLWLDLKIVALTVWRGFRSENAY